MTYMNLLYLGKVTDRVSIIGTFTPSHIGGDAPPIAFGEVFNVSRFIESSNVPMVEWDEVKDPDSATIDAVGCWNVWEAVQYYEHYPRGSSIPDWVGLGESSAYRSGKPSGSMSYTQMSHTPVVRTGSSLSPITSMTNAVLSGRWRDLHTPKTGTRASENHCRRRSTRSP